MKLLELQRAEDLLAKDEIGMGVAYLDRVLTFHLAGMEQAWFCLKR